jgi:hypothetical protein
VAEHALGSAKVDAARHESLEDAGGRTDDFPPTIERAEADGWRPGGSELAADARLKRSMRRAE